MDFCFSFLYLPVDNQNFIAECLPLAVVSFAVFFVHIPFQAEVGQVHMLSKKEGGRRKCGIISPSDWSHPLTLVQWVELFLEPQFEDGCAETHLYCWLPTFLVQILSFALEAICYFSPRFSFIIC